MKYGTYAVLAVVVSFSWGQTAKASIENSAASKSVSEPLTVSGTLKAMELPCMQKHPSGRYFMTSAMGSASGAGIKSTNTTGTATASAGGEGGSGYSVQQGNGPNPEEIRQYQKDLEQYYKQRHELLAKQAEEGKRPALPDPPPFPGMNSSQTQSFSLSAKPLTPAEQKKQWISQVEEDIQSWKKRKEMAINELELIKEYAVKENAVATTEKINELILLKETAASQKIMQLNREKQYITQKGSLPPNRKDSNDNNTIVTRDTDIQAAKTAYYNGEIGKYNDKIADLAVQLKMGRAELNTLKSLANREKASDTEKFIESIIKGKTEFAQSTVRVYKDQVAFFEAGRAGRPISSDQNAGSFGAGGNSGGTGGGGRINR